MGGKDVVLAFDMARCIHARFCVTGAPRTFLANVEGDWLLPDETNADRLAAIATECPSGAITLRRLNDDADETAPEVNLLRVRENGPLAFHADLKIDGEAGGYRRVLCRCGRSQHKPYCDNSDVAAGFQATGEPLTRDSDALVERDGMLVVQPLVNGLLLVSGPLELCSGTGRTVDRVRSARLCGCVASGKKPFCDNSHTRVGFVSSNSASDRVDTRQASGEA